MPFFNPIIDQITIHYKEAQAYWAAQSAATLEDKESYDSIEEICIPEEVVEMEDVQMKEE